MSSYEISLKNDKLLSSILNWIQDSAECTGNYHFENKNPSKIHSQDEVN